MSERAIRTALLLLAAYLVGLGLLALLAPGTFYERIGPYGTRNDHYIRDLATFHLAIGAGALVAVFRAAWRRPVLVVAVVQFAVHTANHIVDIGEAEPGWLGPFAAVSLGLGTVALAAVLLRSGRPS